MPDEFERRKDAILRDLLSLRDRFPHFRDLDESHLDEHGISYRHGDREVPNPDYEREREHIRKVGKALGPGPSKTRTEWADDGISLWLSLTSEELLEARGNAPEEDPEYRDIDLHVYQDDGTSFATVGGLRIQFKIRGSDPSGAIRRAVLEILRSRA